MHELLNHKFSALKKMVFLSAAFALIFSSPSYSVNGKVILYPAPAGEANTEVYNVRVNGLPVDVYMALTQHHDKKYYFSSFDFSGEIKVEVISKSDHVNLKILPESSGIKPEIITKNDMVFSVACPFKISVEPDGEESPLLLFGNSVETNIPEADDPGVVYFGPGIHNPGKILLESNQTLYLAGGAVVKGGVEAHGDNIKIIGRGILDGSDYPHHQGPTVFMVHFEKCRNVIIRDIILRGSWSYTIAPCGSDHVLIDNVKICGSRVSNDDGIDPINSGNVIIQNCFLRTDDDCIAIKGHKGYDKKNCEKIIVKNCSFWTDRANIFRIGFESETNSMQDIAVRNIDVLHFVDDRPPEDFWANCVFYIQPSDNMPMSRLRFENIRIKASDGNNLIIKMMPMICKGMKSLDIKRKTGSFAMWDYHYPGRYVKDVYFKNIILYGKPGNGQGLIYIAGADSQHPVENIKLKNVFRFGIKTFINSPDVIIGPYTDKIKFY